MQRGWVWMALLLTAGCARLAGLDDFRDGETGTGGNGAEGGGNGGTGMGGSMDGPGLVVASPEADVVRAVGSDLAGDVFFVGTHDGEIDLATTHPAIAGHRNVFVGIGPADFSGPTWSLSYGVEGGDAAGTDFPAISVNPAGSFVIAGRVNGPVDLGKGEIASSDADPAAVRFESDRTVGAAEVWVGMGAQLATDALVQAGTTVLVGRFANASPFGTKASAQGSSDGFVVTLDEALAELNTVDVKGPDYQAAQAVAGNDSDQLFVAGVTRGDLDIAGMTYPHLNATGTGDEKEDVFVARFPNNLSSNIAVLLGGDNRDTVTSVAVSGDHLYLVGQFEDTFDCTVRTLVAPSGVHGYVLKLDFELAPMECTQLTSTNEVLPRHVAALSDGRIAIAGSFQGDTDLGAGVLPATGTDGFVALFDAATLQLVHQDVFANEGVVDVLALAVDPSDRLLLGGFFSSPVDFGFGPLAHNGGFDGYVVRITPPP